LVFHPPGKGKEFSDAPYSAKLPRRNCLARWHAGLDARLVASSR